jgi:hypothetical protein
MLVMSLEKSFDILRAILAIGVHHDQDLVLMPVIDFAEPNGNRALVPKIQVQMYDLHAAQRSDRRLREQIVRHRLVGTVIDYNDRWLDTKLE